MVSVRVLTAGSCLFGRLSTKFICPVSCCAGFRCETAPAEVAVMSALIEGDPPRPPPGEDIPPERVAMRAWARAPSVLLPLRLGVRAPLRLLACLLTCFLLGLLLAAEPRSLSKPVVLPLLMDEEPASEPVEGVAAGERVIDSASTKALVRASSGLLLLRLSLFLLADLAAFFFARFWASSTSRNANAVKLPLLRDPESSLCISACSIAKPLPRLDAPEGLRGVGLPDVDPQIFDPAGMLCSSVVLGDVIWTSAARIRFPEDVCCTGMDVGDAAVPEINIVAEGVPWTGLPGSGDIMEAPI